MLGFVLERPYVLVFTAYACGIAIGHALPFPLELLNGSVLLFWIIFAALSAFWSIWRRHPSIGLGVGFGGILVLAGWLSVSLQLGAAQSAPLLRLQQRELQTLRREHEKQRSNPEPVTTGAGLDQDISAQGASKSPPSDVDMVLRGNVVSIPKVQRGYLRFMLRVQKARSADQWYRAGGLCYCFVKLDAASADIAAPSLGVHYGSRIDLYSRVSEVEGPRNNGQFNYRAYLLQQGTLLQAFAYSPRALIVKDKHPPQPWASLASVRSYLTRNLTRGLDAETAALAISVVYGDKITDLPECTRQRFREAGLTHILVASGTQVSLLIALLGLAFWRLEDNATWRGRLLNLLQFGVTMTVVIGYATVTGFETSILRALAMGTLVLLGKLLLRESDGLTALAQSGLVLLLINPLNLFSASFQLSFGATFGLIYFYGVFAPLLGQPGSLSPDGAGPGAITGANDAPLSFRDMLRPATWLAWLREHGRQALISTCGAQLMVTPLLLSSFFQFSLWGFISNLLAIPLAFLLLIFGALSSTGLSAMPLFGQLLQLLVMLLARGLDGVAALFAMLPGSQVAAPAPQVWWVLAYYLLLLGLGELYRRRRHEQLPHPSLRWLVLTAALAVASGFLYWWLVPQPGLTAFALPGSEAYLYRSHSGRNLLLVRAGGLERQHNAETLSAALHRRGMNVLHGLVWLDEAPVDADKRDVLFNELGFKPRRELRVGEALPPGLDCRWWPQGEMVESDEASILECRLSGRSVDLLLGPGASQVVVSQSTDAQLQLGEHALAANFGCISLANWEKLDAGEQEVLSAAIGQVYVVDAKEAGLTPVPGDSVILISRELTLP